MFFLFHLLLPDDDDRDQKDCDKNTGNNCNDIKEIMKQSPKLKCKIDSNIEDLRVGERIDGTNLICEMDTIGSIDSNVTINNSPSGGGNGGNGDFTSPTVVSVTPNDNENDVSLSTEIKVTFDENMNQDSLDDGSIQIFNLDSDVEPNVNADPSAQSVTYTLDRDLEPGTRYEAKLDFNIQDEAGNFLDCTNSDDVDSSCSWQFETTGTGNANIELTPTSGSVGTSVHITGTGFNLNSEVTITFDQVVVATSTTNNNGEFDADFDVPISVSGSHTVAASDGSNSDSASFTVTSSANPIITLNPTFGPVGANVTVTGINFDPDSEVVLTFAGDPVATSTAKVTTSTTGGFSANFTVPTSTLGIKTVSAID